MGWAFKDAYVGIVNFFLPEAGMLANYSLVSLLLLTIAVLIVQDHVPSTRKLLL